MDTSYDLFCHGLLFCLYQLLLLQCMNTNTIGRDDRQKVELSHLNFLPSLFGMITPSESLYAKYILRLPMASCLA